MGKDHNIALSQKHIYKSNLKCQQYYIAYVPYEDLSSEYNWGQKLKEIQRTVRYMGNKGFHNYLLIC